MHFTSSVECYVFISVLKLNSTFNSIHNSLLVITRHHSRINHTLGKLNISVEFEFAVDHEFVGFVSVLTKVRTVYVLQQGMV